ncbi:MAG TPA: TonB family protein [Polyangia bacterium]|nr:TonB family protein [Polyangia bacterium]
MRGRTVVISIALHVLVFALAMTVAKSRASRRATSVAVVGEKKKAEKKEEKPKPKPKPLVASARPEPAKANAAPKIVPTHAPEPARETAAPVDTNITMGNDDGPGIDVGGPAIAPKQNAQAQQQNKSAQKNAPAVKKEKVIAPRDNPEEDNCTEAPSKPAPVQRATEIEYTQEARANGVEGRLVLKITVNADGSVASVDVVSSVDAALDAAAVAAVKTWVFKPAMRCGKPLGGATFTLARRFELGD